MIKLGITQISLKSASSAAFSFRVRCPQQVRQYVVRLGSDDLVLACDKAWYSSDAAPARFLPIGIHRIFESTVCEHLSGSVAGKTHRPCNVDENFRITNVAAIDEVSPVERIVNGFKTRLRIRPFCEFLRQATVIGVGAPGVRQPLGIHEPFHASVHGFQIEAAAGEEVFEWKSLCGSVRMQWEVHPADVDVEISFQLFNTNRTEVAPGSNEICEYLQCGH